MAMSGIRQATAIGFLMSSFAYSLSNKNLKSYVLIIFAISTHVSSIIVLPILLYMNHKSKLNVKMASYIIVITIVIVGFLLSFSNILLAGIYRYSLGQISSEGAVFRIGILSFLLACVTFLKRAKNVSNKYKDILNVTQLYAFVLLMMSFLNSVVADRLLYNILPLHAYLLASSTRLISVNKEIILVFSIILYMTLFLYWSLNSYFFQVCYTPYDSYIMDIF
jgi:hypothetical protein